MMKEIKVEEAIGKTLTMIGPSYDDQQMVFVFSDGTFITIGTDHGYNNDIGVFFQKIELSTFGNEQLIELGVVTQEEIDEKIRTLDAEHKNKIRRLKGSIWNVKVRSIVDSIY